MLVSKSPRRADLLKSAGYHFEPFPLETSEIIDKNLNSFEQTRRLACMKMEHFKGKYGLKYKNFSYALTCDTLVDFEGRTLGKPRNFLEAKSWLLSYSGKRQCVYTGVCLMRLDGSGKILDWVATTEIFFKSFDVVDVEDYLSKQGDVLDKAGAYGIQDKNFKLVKRIKGSYSNVVGLPLEDLKLKLIEMENL